MKAIWGLVLVSLAACKEPSRAAPRPPPDAFPELPPLPPEPPIEPGPPPECDPVGKDLCVGDDVVMCAPGGKLGRKVKTCPDGCQAGRCVDECAATGVDLIYVIDDANELLSFDPKKLPGDPFHLVGTVSCESWSTPFSMAVDRQGFAWVLYRSGAVYRVSIADATCTATGYSASAGALFGMGFVTDAPGATTEHLYIADAHLAVLDIAAARRTDLGAIDAGQSKNPELTGTAEGDLFGYFPEPDRGYVVGLDRATGKPIGKRMFLDRLDGDVDAWAFAHWGGTFYVFASTPSGSAVHSIDRRSGTYALVRPSPYRVVGAGVSTCAPTL